VTVKAPGPFLLLFYNKVVMKKSHNGRILDVDTEVVTVSSQCCYHFITSAGKGGLMDTPEKGEKVHPMSEPLLIQLLNLWISQGRAPDVLSKEWTSEGVPLIRFEWYAGRVREYPCTAVVYDLAWRIFNEYWRLRAA
jgi:hypothetical protein